MKKLIVITLLFIGTISAQAQLHIGVKAGANFANLDGASGASMRTGFHGGAVLEVEASSNLSIQAELLYSMQGAKFDAAGIDDIDFSYVTVPVLARYYIISDTFSLDAGPQFAFLVDDNIPDSVINTFETKSFDFAVVGGATLHITKSFYAQGRYVVGLTDASTEAFSNANFKNRVIQLSLGYNFL
jgi:outer membrane protein with beta-barrel domain